MTKSELDILVIDSNIRKKFEEQSSQIPEYERRLQDLELTVTSDNLSIRARDELNKNIAHLKNLIEKLRANSDLHFYTMESAMYIQRYKEILRTPLKVSFIGKTTKGSKEKRDIIKKYLLVAQKYIDIPHVDSKKKVKVVCPECDGKTEFEIDDNIYICLECGLQQEILQHNSSYKDIDRVNISTKYKYDKKTHFRDCINQYQGKQNCTIDKKIYDGLIDAFERHHLLCGGEEVPIKRRFAKITKEHILMFLKELGYSKHYENVTLIHYNLTGRKPDNITHLEDKLMNDFDLIIKTYDEHFRDKIDRVNFISTQYVLYQLLLRHKHPCKKEDFVILKTIDRKIFHDMIVKDIFEKLSWNHHSL